MRSHQHAGAPFPSNVRSKSPAPITRVLGSFATRCVRTRPVADWQDAVGGILEEADRSIYPTLLTDVTPDMLIMQEEIFAPIVPVMTCENFDDAVAYIAERNKLLALYMYSDNQDNIDKVLKRTSSGGVTINGFFSHYLENRLPFGGVNQSGMGSYHGFFDFKAFSHERAIYIQQNK